MEMFNLYEAVNTLLRHFPKQLTELEQFLLDQETPGQWNTRDVKRILNFVSARLLNESFTTDIAAVFTPILNELLERCAATAAPEDVGKHEGICKMLSKLIWIYRDVERFAHAYFDKSPHIFVRFHDNGEGPSTKRAKLPKKHHDILSSLLVASLQFLTFDISYFKDIWDWSLLSVFIEHGNFDAKWLAYQCMFRLFNISAHDQNKILEDAIPKVEVMKLSAKYTMLVSRTFVNDALCPISEGYSSEERYIPNTCLTPASVCVEGVFFNRFLSKAKLNKNELLVPVDSLKSSVHELALLVQAGFPVLLQGPVGCGKTSLVEHLALSTGRNPHSDLLRVQLGDQLDSKLLIGSYVCTETCGEFLWQPGILTQAMTEGHWLLMEDIDCAPLEIISTLAPIIETRSLYLPGRAIPIKAHANFHLFFTQRLMIGQDRSFLEFKSSADMFNKLWKVITLQNLPQNEISEIISKKWPVLLQIIDRIMNVYQLFAFEMPKGRHDSDEEVDEVLPSTVKRNRLISVRDLYKFCQRVAKGFDNKAPKPSEIFKHAMDCYCGNLPNVQDRVTSAESIGVQFNIAKSEAVSLCTKSKPDFEEYSDRVQIGRATLQKKPDDRVFSARPIQISFAYTRQALDLLEKVAVSVAEREPVLLVGETGTGKTSIVQYLANATKNKLNVVNMNQQSDSIDLLGGYKPVDLSLIVTPIREEFSSIFPLTFSERQNVKFLGHVSKCFVSKRWDVLFSLMIHSQQAAVKRLSNLDEQSNIMYAEKVLKRWRRLGQKLQRMKTQLKESKSPLAFKFIEGVLVRAMKNGEWILLDEINLAEAETLQCLGGVLESDVESLVLLEKGDKEPFKRDPNFRIFACMNPATDVGKKELPVGIRNRFTEFYIEELEDKNDLIILVQQYLCALNLNPPVVDSIVTFYLHMRSEAIKKLNDGTGHPPHYSLRSLCRALRYAAENNCGSLHRSLYEAFALSFLSQLDRSSYPIVNKAIIKHLLDEKHVHVLKQLIPAPPGGNHINVQGYWISAGSCKPNVEINYVLTPSVQQNLHNLARIVSVGRYPVLLQGETSVGKTSMVEYLANCTGNYCVRVNNHEHTDIQEYIGSYCSDKEGKLVYKEGVLVEAMKKGYWIILDELNLAPTEVMEALNRVLDDNRELFITETQELVKADPKFMVFATQNPPGLYGGRKVLSRAFRNRFIELYFDELPPSELEIILEKRCSLPLSYCKKMVAVMQDLQLQRRESRIFAGKQSYITLRDLFRWGERYRLAAESVTKFYDWDQHMADEGYMLLAGKVRRHEEVVIIQQILEKNMKRRVDPDVLFTFENSKPKIDILNGVAGFDDPEEFQHIVWTPKMKRLITLLSKALKFQEPVLLVGDTGCGKTTICQLIAKVCEKKLHMVNCHMHSESADFLGNLRPVRTQSEDNQRLFEWVDGPLVRAMAEGNFFLIDEISLADDSVLERLNSVLEYKRELRLTEKSGDDSENAVITAHEEFRIMATMNPGGDYGKKELSPALRNRFTEIWCPSDLANDDVISIIEHNIKDGIYLTCEQGESGFGYAINQFLEWYLGTDVGKRITVSIRDILTWVNFINSTVQQKNQDHIGLTPCEAYVHGACLVFLDGLGSNSLPTSNPEGIQEIKNSSYRFLLHQVKGYIQKAEFCELGDALMNNWQSYMYMEKTIKGVPSFGFGPFLIPAVTQVATPTSYYLETPATKCNTVRLLRAMQLWKPILLEGSPGVGKTSLVTTLAKAAGFRLVRINLSEQTDITDLFGADLPVDGGKCGQFSWRDGPLVEALKAGSWILLDELNLASQSVLEGLNACLDHRGEIYIPELGKTFNVSNRSTRIFACQNPFRQGGSRKGLPRSFLNRFAQVFMEPLSPLDLKLIACYMFPCIPSPVISEIIDFNKKIMTEVYDGSLSRNKGYGWEFNLRDIFRLCEVMSVDQVDAVYRPVDYVGLIYADRMRTLQDKQKVYEICESHFNVKTDELVRHVDVQLFDTFVQVGHSFIQRKGHGHYNRQLLYPLHFQIPIVESLMKCIEMNWLPILVGPAASGKSSVVHLVAQLTGHHLNVLSVNSEMDTTELLGGFEQADPIRCLEAVRDLEPFIQGAVVACLKELPAQHSDFVFSILAASHKFHNVERTQLGSSNGEDYGAYHHVSKYLNSITVSLAKLGKQLEEKEVSAFTELQQAVNRLSEELAPKAAKHVGGRFEWVDSILVQAVQKGHWLLIEDVNLCSPSVLDRLNGLLEPDGVLSLFEQGSVDCNGRQQLRTIKPHPEFRIIFTMNPLHGEISPAMRNRGVEIAIANEVTGLHGDVIIPNLWDIFCLMHAKKLCDPLPVFYVFKIYNQLHTQKAVVPSSHDLQNVVDLCVLNIQDKRSMSEALFDSFDSAFIRNILDRSDRFHMYDLLRTEITKLDIEDNERSAHRSAYDHVLLSVGPSVVEFNLSYAYAGVRQKTALFVHLLKSFLSSYRQAPDSTFSIRGPTITYPAPTATDDWINIFSIAIRMLAQSATPKQCEVFRIWFEFTWKEISSKISDPEDEQHKCFRKVLTPIRNLIKGHLNLLLNFTVTTDLVQTVGTMLNSWMGVDREDIPIDPRWNPQLLRKIVSKFLKQSNNASLDMKDLRQNIHSYANRFLLLLNLSIFKFLESELGKVWKLNYTSLYGLSETLSTVGLKEQPHPIIPEVAPFITMLYSALTTELEHSPVNYTTEYFWAVWDLLSAYRQFVKFCYEPILDQTMADRINMFALHYAKFIKKLSIFYNSPTFRAGHSIGIPPEVNEAIQRISRALNFENETVQKIRLKTMKTFGCPPAFQSENCAKIFLDAMGIYQNANIYLLLKSPSQVDDLKLVISNTFKWNRILLNAICKALSRNMSNNVSFPELALTLHEMKLQVRDLGLGNNGEDDDVMEVCQQPVASTNIKNSQLALHIELLPFWHYFFFHAEAVFLLCTADMRKAALKGFFTPDLTKYKLSEKFLLDIGLSKLSYDPVHIGQLLCLHKDEKKGLFPSCISSLLHSMQFDPFSNGDEIFFKMSSALLKKEDKSVTPPKAMWVKQAPLLTITCLKLFDGANSSGPITLPLGTFYEKKQQIEVVKTVLWRSREALGKRSVWRNMATIVSCWFDDIVAALSVFTTINVGLPLTDILNKMWQDLELSRILPYSSSNVLVDARDCILSMATALDVGNRDPLTLNWCVGTSFAKVGLLTYTLFAPLHSYDPVQKRLLAFNCSRTLTRDTFMEWYFQDWQHKSVGSHGMRENNSDTHPYIHGLSHLMVELKARTEKLEQKLSFRPSTLQFGDMKAEVEKFLSLVGSPHTAYETISTFLKLMKEHTGEGRLNENEWKKFSLSVATQSENLKSFIDDITGKFPHYRDQLFPFLTGVEMLLVGYKILGRCVACAITRQNNPGMHGIESHLIKMCSFPSLQENSTVLRPLQLATLLSSADATKVLATLKSLAGVPENDGSIFKLLRSGLLELINDVLILKEIPNKKLMGTANPILRSFYKALQQQNDEFLEKKNAEESLYIHKIRIYGDDPLDGDGLIKEKARFPSFEEDFKEFMPIELDADVPEDMDNGESSLLLKPEDSFELWQCHATFMVKLLYRDKDVVERYMEPVIKPMDQPDYVTPYLLRYEVLQVILPALHSIDSSIDIHLIGGHLLTASTLQLQDDMRNPSQNRNRDAYFDIYHDPHPTEALQLLPLLEALASHVVSILKEFPENPILTQILKIVERIQSFPVTSPLMKFVTGLQLVLESVHTWEQNAHKGVSLQPELEPLTQKLIYFRKLEHKCWSNCLDSITKRSYIECAKWWFYIYSIILTTEDGDKDDMATVLAGLQQFVEDCTIGQFSARLALLQTFVHHLNAIDKTDTQRKIKDILSNVYVFYKQFLPTVEAKINEVRKPVEKEVKDFLKIARWNDTNFISIKKSVEKTHQTLHKVMHKYEVGLRQLARNNFRINERNRLEVSQLNFIPDIGDLAPVNILPVVSSVEGKICSFKHDDVFDKIPQYCKTSGKLCKNITTNIRLVDEIKTLDEIADGILESFQRVQALEVKRNVDKEAQMKQFRHNVQMKKKAIADMFKQFVVMGLSYRKGNIFCDKKLATSGSNTMLVPCFEVALWDTYDVLFQPFVNLTASWIEADHYYYKGIAQFAIFDLSMNCPIKEMKDAIVIDKFSGYAGHVLQNVIGLRQRLVRDGEMIMTLSDSLSCLVNIISDHEKEHVRAIRRNQKCYYPPQGFVDHWKNDLFTLLVQASTAFQQFDVLLKCCPQAIEEHSLALQPHVSSVLANLVKGDKLCAGLACEVGVCVDGIKASIASLLPFLERESKLYTWDHLSVIGHKLKKLASRVETFAAARCIHFHNVSELETSDSNFTTFLLNLRVSINEKLELFTKEFTAIQEGLTLSAGPQTSLTETDESAALMAHKLFHSALKSIENISNLFSDHSAQGDSEAAVVDNLFTKNISGILSKFSMFLNIPCISKNIEQLIKELRGVEKSPPSVPVFERYIASIVPVLQQYSHMLKLYLHTAVIAHRTSNKLLCIMLDTFLEFTQKGFGIPPDREEDSGNGGTQFRDIEQCGLGEGEGTKDVSKDIKSEDQLEDTTLEGQKQEQDNSSDVKAEEEAVEMSEDFDGELHKPEKGDTANDDEDDDDEDDDEDDDDFDSYDSLDKQMGDVDDPDADKLDEKIWGSESDEDDDLEEDSSGRGMTQDKVSDLVAKDDKAKEFDKDTNRSDKCPDLKNEEEYDGERVDPLIDAPPLLVPEVLDLPEELQIDSDEDDNKEREQVEDIDDDVMEIDPVKEEEDAGEATDDYEEDLGDQCEKGDNSNEDDENAAEANKETEKESNVESLNEDDKKDDNLVEENDDKAAPTKSPSKDSENRAYASQSAENSSLDLILPTEIPEEWKRGGNDNSEQHHEGQAGVEDLSSMDSTDKRGRATMFQSDLEEQKNKRMKHSDENRTLGLPDIPPLEELPIKSSSAPKDDHKDVTKSNEYEHMQGIEEKASHPQVLDAATEQQARQQPSIRKFEPKFDDDDDVIDLDSSSDDEPEPVQRMDASRFPGTVATIKKENGVAGEILSSDEEMEVDDSSALVSTQGAKYRPESTVHTQYNLWSALSLPHIQNLRHQIEEKLDIWSAEKSSDEVPFWLWQNIETIVSPLVHELCEQLRLALEPTKMSKMKGDYRTGKRLNMKKIIPYIASQFRKDKIWLRRTKPSKRQYQIMLAVDDSSSMSDNHSKELAFESLALLAKSLSLLEAGELAVVSFGEDVKLLHGFGEPFTSNSGAHILEAFSFAQKNTRVCRLVDYVTQAMGEARGAQTKTRDVSQLLIIISDGRGVFSEGEGPMHAAIRRARLNNIFMVFVILDNPANKDSIMDIQIARFDENKDVHMRPYLEKFPFPFYMVLRTIEALPQVLGEALRQWFELVTSAER